MRTELCDLLDIKYPIIQGGMTLLGNWQLASAVSEAGGLGFIGAGDAPPEYVLEQISRVRSQTQKPVGINVLLSSPYFEEVMALIIGGKVPVVATGSGNPEGCIDRFKEAGIKVIPVVSTVAMARRAEHAGADAIVAEGVESGGHVGETTTMALLPQIVDAVSIPVIAAGGIAEGRGMAAAMALGAQGIQMGTRFVSSTECIAHPDFKQRIIRASDRATVVAGKSTGHPVRILKNKMARQLLAMEKARASEADLAHFMENTLRRGVLEGDVEHGLLMSGQTAGLVKSVKPVRAIIEDTVSEAEVVLRHLTASSPAVDRHLT